MRFSITSALLVLPFTANSVLLSTITDKEIQGAAPYLQLLDGAEGTAGTKLTTLDALLGFSMPNGDGGIDIIDATKSTTRGGEALQVPAGMTFQDVVTLVTADGENNSVSGAVVGDVNGDADISDNTSITGSMTATWYKGEATLANKVTDLTQALVGGCDGGTYKLVISATDVEAKTTYGVPNSYSYGSSTPITYTFNAPVSEDTKGCIKNFRPASMHVYTGIATGEHPKIKYAVGYNEATWEKGTYSNSTLIQTGGGFKRNSGFPATGFKGAQFDIIGSASDQSNYRCTSPDDTGEGGTKITLSGTKSADLGANCTVLYNSTTKKEFIAGGTPTITLEYSADGNSNWVALDSFTIPKPSKWAIDGGNGSTRMYSAKEDMPTSTSFPALDACRKVGSKADGGTTTWPEAGGPDRTIRETYLYRRNELTNSPFADPVKYKEYTVPDYSGYSSFSRETDGKNSTFMGEWGIMSKYSKATVWKGWYWTNEIQATNFVFFVYATGHPNSVGVRYDGTAVCRDDADE